MALHAAGGGWLAGPMLSVRDGNAVMLSLMGAGCKTGIDCTSIPARYALLWEVKSVPASIDCGVAALAAGWFFLLFFYMIPISLQNKVF